MDDTVFKDIHFQFHDQRVFADHTLDPNSLGRFSVSLVEGGDMLNSLAQVFLLLHN